MERFICPYIILPSRLINEISNSFICWFTITKIFFNKNLKESIANHWMVGDIEREIIFSYFLGPAFRAGQMQQGASPCPTEPLG